MAAKTEINKLIEKLTHSLMEDLIDSPFKFNSDVMNEEDKDYKKDFLAVDCVKMWLESCIANEDKCSHEYIGRFMDEIQSLIIERLDFSYISKTLLDHFEEYDDDEGCPKLESLPDKILINRASLNEFFKYYEDSPKKASDALYNDLQSQFYVPPEKEVLEVD